MKKLILGLLTLASAWQLSAADDWLTVLQNPLSRAKAQNKLVLLDFTGSDWCGWCKKFKAEALDTAEFKQYAQSNLILVEVDFPHDVAQSEALKKANTAWRAKFQAQGFPTFILVDADAKELGRQRGYDEGGPGPFIQKLNKWKANAPAKAAAAPVAAAPASGELWLTDLPQAQARARAEKKMVLMDFTGSDWCGWCIKLKDEVFSKPEFVAYARKNLVLVEVDFPRKKSQSPEQKSANARLAQQYAIEGYPSVIILDANGKKIGENGYQEGGPRPYIAMLEALKSAAP